MVMRNLFNRQHHARLAILQSQKPGACALLLKLPVFTESVCAFYS